MYLIFDALRKEEPGVFRKADPGFCILVLKDAVVKSRDDALSEERLPAKCKAWGLLKLHIKLRVLAREYSPSLWEMQTGCQKFKVI